MSDVPQIDPRLMFDLLQECTHLDVPKISAIWTAGQAAIKTLENAGYIYSDGAELWKPPLGKKPDFDLFDTQRERFHAVCSWVLHEAVHSEDCHSHTNYGLGEFGSCDCGLEDIMKIVMREVET